LTVLVALLRGLNVGGHRKARMEDLVSACESIGGRDVRTYVQSGNLVFRSSRAPDRVAAVLEARLEKDLGFPVKVMVRSRERLREIVEANPFLGRAGIDPGRLAVTFLSGPPGRGLAKIELSARDQNDEYVVIGSEAFLHCPGGFAKTAFSNAFFEKKLGLDATSRSWRTVTALLKMARDEA
jgi:uncharacterized protein (DUF1697 family)